MMTQMGAQAAAQRAHEELFAYWSSRRAPGRLPSRANIHPEDFKRHLPTVSLTEVHHLGTPDGIDGHVTRRYRLRLAGTGLYSVYGGEITGKPLEEVYPGPAADYWRRELDGVVEGRKPAVGVHNLGWRGSPHMSILWLRLPLATDGREVDMILGYDVAVGGGSPSALGLTGIRAA